MSVGFHDQLFFFFFFFFFCLFIFMPYIYELRHDRIMVFDLFSLLYTSFLGVRFIHLICIFGLISTEIKPLY